MREGGGGEEGEEEEERVGGGGCRPTRVPPPLQDAQSSDVLFAAWILLQRSSVAGKYYGLGEGGERAGRGAGGGQTSA